MNDRHAYANRSDRHLVNDLAGMANHAYDFDSHEDAGVMGEASIRLEELSQAVQEVYSLLDRVARPSTAVCRAIDVLEDAGASPQPEPDSFGAWLDRQRCHCGDRATHRDGTATVCNKHMTDDARALND